MKDEDGKYMIMSLTMDADEKNFYIVSQNTKYEDKSANFYKISKYQFDKNDRFEFVAEYKGKKPELTIKGKDVKVGAPGDKFNRIVPIK